MNTVNVTNSNLQNCVDFLESKKESCMFLLGNLADYGYKQSDHVNSGNYYIIKNENEILCAFSLTRGGNLLIQSDAKRDYSNEIFKTVSTSKSNINGIIGPWKDCIAFKKLYESISNKSIFSFVSHEMLFSLPLSKVKITSTTSDLKTRLLHIDDYSQWDKLNREFLIEESLPLQSDGEERKQSFEIKTKNKFWWGAFKDNELISIGAYNARYKELGQIGGVYTPHKHRRKGYSRICMNQLISDSAKVHSLTDLILFTGETNTAAQGLYSSLGFKSIGDFGLVFR